MADGDGNMVSLIQSNYRGMGCGVCPEGLGFSLQDRGELFNLEEGHANTYAPGKRPFHTIIPAFVTKDGKPWLSFGVMGGATQPQAHAQIIINLVDFGMNLQEAGDAPRILHTGSSQPTGERDDRRRRGFPGVGHRLRSAPGTGRDGATGCRSTSAPSAATRRSCSTRTRASTSAPPNRARTARRPGTEEGS